LYWFPSLTLSSNVVGRTYYGKYTDTNSPPLDGSDPWMLATNSSVHLLFKTASQTGSNPDAAGLATLSTVPSLAARFTASRTFGASPLFETFTDTSIGYIAHRFWDFGDGTTLTTTATNVTHIYAAGNYTVTLVVADPLDISTDATTSVIEVLTPFQIWQMEYFTCTDCPEADADTDSDGDKFTNLQEFLANTDPTDSHSSPFQITALAQQGDDVVLTWTTVGGTTNVAQATDITTDDGWWTNFVDISPAIQIPDSTVTSTNYLDPGAVTNYPSRLYRIRVVP
jgi:PKD repeat protein